MTYSAIKTGMLFIVATLMTVSASICSEVPTTINYQGRLTDAAGNPVTDGPHDLTFRIYDESSVLCWEELHIVTTSDGLFSVELGSGGSPLTADIFASSERWLGISVDSETEMTPRTHFTSVPYALRAGSVSASDILNEPGVAGYVGPSYPTYLEDSSYNVICSLTINCPAAGYVMALCHSRLATMPEHTYGTVSHAFFGISDNRYALPGNQDIDFQIPGPAPTGIYSVPCGLTGMFPVTSAGLHTYYYLAYVDSGSAISVADIQFSLVYFPTAYGTVDPVPPPQPQKLESDPVLTPEAQMDSRTEPAASDVSRLERELAAMKERMEHLQRQLDSLSVGR